MIQKIMFSFVFSSPLLILFYFFTVKLLKKFYLTTSCDVGTDSIYKTKQCFHNFCLRVHLRTDRPNKAFLTKNSIIQIVGGSFEQRINVYRKRIIKRVRYFITKTESGSSERNWVSIC